MTTVKVIQKRNNSTEITLSGDLTIYSVMEIFQKYFQKIKFKTLVIIRLSAIEEVDTAGVQLLIMLFKAIEQQGANYIVHSNSASLNEYNTLFGLQHYFHDRCNSQEAE